MAERIVSHEFPDRPPENIYAAEGGFAHDTFFVDFKSESFVVKINGLSSSEDEDWDASFATEPYILELVREKTEVPVPEPVARDTTRSIIPEYYHIIRKVEGYSPSRDSSGTSFRNLGKTDKGEIVRQIAENVAEIHNNVKFSGFGEIRLNEGDELTVENEQSWPELFREITFFWIEKLEGDRFGDLMEDLKETVERNLHLLEDVSEPVLVHREIDDKNVLVKDGQLTSIVDWEYCIAGHHEFELAVTEGRMIESNFKTDEIWKSYRDELYCLYREKRSLDDGWEQRRLLYLIYPLAMEMFFFPVSGVNSEKNIRRRVDKITEKLS